MAFKKSNKGKSKAEANEQNNGMTPGVTMSPSKRKKKDTMASVLHETVMENMVDELRANEGFVVDGREGETYVLMALNVSKIGGLSKSSAKGDEAKGAIIECINSGRISTIVSDALVEQDMLLFVPSMDTIDAMDEFGILREAPYTMAFLEGDDSVSITSTAVSFDQIREVVEKGASVEPLMKELGLGKYLAGWTEEAAKADDDTVEDDLTDAIYGEDDEDELPFGDDEPATPAPAEDEPVSSAGFEDEIEDEPEEDPEDMSIDEVASEDDDVYEDAAGEEEEFDISQFDDGAVVEGDGTFLTSEEDQAADPGFDFGMPDMDFSTPAYEEDEIAPAPEDDGFEPDAPAPNTFADEADDDLDAAPAVTSIPEEVMNKTIARRFYSDDLGLEVTSDPFDAQFLRHDNLILFDTDRDISGDNGWIADYLNQTSKYANSELTRMHYHHLDEARKQFFQLVSLHVEKIQKELDISKTTTDYGAMAADLREQRDEAMANVAEEVEAKRAEITAEFESKVEEVGKAAAVAAMQQYRDRYGRSVDGKVQDAKQEVESAIEGSYRDALRDMYASRKDDASKLMDYGITESLSVVMGNYEAMLKAEQDLYDIHKNKMQQYLNEHSVDSVAKIAAMTEEVRKAEMARDEARQKAADFMQECEQRMASLREEIRANQSHYAELSRQKDAECDRRVQAALDDNKKLRDEYMKMVKKYNALGASKEAECEQKYAAQLQELKDEKKDVQASLRDTQYELRDVRANQKRNNIIFLMLGVVFIVVSLVVGYLFGMTINVANTVDTPKESEAIVTEGTAPSMELPTNPVVPETEPMVTESVEATGETMDFVQPDLVTDTEPVDATNATDVTDGQ